MTSAC